MSKTSADWADYQVQASLRSMGGSGKEKDPPPPNVFLTANVEAINNKFNAFYSQLGGAVTSTVNRGLACLLRILMIKQANIRVSI